MSPSSLLTPAYELTIGSQRWTTQAAAITVALDAAPLVNAVRAWFPVAAPVDAAAGDAVALTLDGGEGSATVFTGWVERIRRTTESTVVHALDAGGRLAAYRPSITFEQATAASVIRGLCDDVGVDTGPVDDGPTLAYYAADPSRTAIEHAARVAGWGGATVTVDGDGTLRSAVVNGAAPDLALRYGREPLRLVQTRVADHVGSFVIAGESSTTATSAADALRPSTDFFAGDRPDGPSSTARWSFEPVLRTPEQAAMAAAATTRSYRSSRHRTTLDAWLLPDLRPGTVLTFEDVPDVMAAGPFWVVRVAHALSPTGATTRARLAEGGDAFDPVGLLGSVAGLR